MGREVLLVGAAMIAEQPASALLAPLALAIPAVVLVNYVQELSFARKWKRVLLEKRGRRDLRRSRRSGLEEALA